MGYRSTMSDDILSKNDRYPLDLDDIRLKAPIEGEKIQLEELRFPLDKSDFYGISFYDVRRYRFYNDMSLKRRIVIFFYLNDILLKLWGSTISQGNCTISSFSGISLTAVIFVLMKLK